MRLCNAQSGSVFRFDGKLIHFVAHHACTAQGVEVLHRAFPIYAHRGSASGRAILSGAIERIPDVLADPDYTLGEVAEIFRSIVAVPMLHQGKALGTINVSRFEAGAFSERQIQMLETFANQAVIAIENTRLFEVEQTRTRELRDALEQQTATGEILSAIGASMTDARPVFEAIVRSLLRLFGTRFAFVA